MTNPRITVVVPAFNLGAYLGDCLRSVERQGFTDWTCIVVNDGSTDDTAAVASSFVDPRFQLLTQANAGVSAARNAGWQAAGGELVMFLDGDDVLHPSALERLQSALVARPDCICAYGAMRKMLDGGAPYPGEKPLELVSYPDGDVLRAMVTENFLANGGQVLLRSSLAQPAGGFDARLKLSEDWEFWCRLAAIGPFAYIGAPPEVFTLRMRPGSASGGLASEWDNHLPAIEAVLGNVGIAARFETAEWQELTDRVWASHLFEAGRVNFTIRRFEVARRLMLRSLARRPTVKRLVLFVLAELSRLTNRSLVSRLRFRDHDIGLAG